jgi:hypothetical protein
MVYRFRYSEHFRLFKGGYPGVDHDLKWVYEPHDEFSQHTCAFAPDGSLAAVSTASRASLDCLPPDWKKWFDFKRLESLDLARLVVSTRMVLRRDLRGSGLFKEFYSELMTGYVRQGLVGSLHYIRPGLASRYTSLGHRFYSSCFNLPQGQLRAPMLILFSDRAYLESCVSPLLSLCVAKGLDLFQDLSPKAESILEGPIGEQGRFNLLNLEERKRYAEQKLTAAQAQDAAQKLGRLPRELLQPLLLASPLSWEGGSRLDAPLAESQMGLLLSGGVCETSAQGSRLIEPGDFLGLSFCSCDPQEWLTAYAEKPGQALFFDSCLARLCFEHVKHASSREEVWSCLAEACTGCLDRARPFAAVTN